MILLCVSIALLWAGVALVDDRNHKRAMFESYRWSGNLARAFEEHTLRTLRVVDQVLLETKYQYETRGLEFDLQGHFASLQLDSALYVNAVISDERGDVVLGSSLITTKVNLADREHVRVHKARDSGTFFVSKPVQARVARRSHSSRSALRWSWLRLPPF